TATTPAAGGLLASAGNSRFGRQLLGNLIGRQRLDFGPPLTGLAQLVRLAGTQQQEIVGRAETRVRHQAEYALAGAFGKARLQRPDVLDRVTEAARDRHALALLR